ncbi:acyl-CoA reductase-like NAD-dependent aldehyde dehydrogenase [Bradyrhizobium centrosematis]|nr:acyl-CoA reductase-like NAD-dependent aldehyde dehydrogenase [Bradyrhizobium centrosematis]MCS3777977.1 acyl-CoA reductase-like NAD-dependent aldehyde dehydrogenase [Bradyrhizobium centrosematis]
MSAPRIANDFPFSLAAAIAPVTSPARIELPPPSAGVVWVNDHHRLDPASPWGGLAATGRECGTQTFDDHLETKSVMIATHEQPFDWYRDTANQKRLN